MSQAIHLPIDQQEILEAIQIARASDYIDNLRKRHPLVAFDSRLRGLIGERCFEKWLNLHSIEATAKNQMDEGTGMDIDFSFQFGERSIHLELKTSLLPDVDQTIENVIRNRDIKLIRRGTQEVNQLSGDVHCQIIYQQLRLRKDDWLKKQKTGILKASKEEIYEALACRRYLQDCYFVGWIDKATLIEQIKNKNAYLQIWKYGFREFWTCNLMREANPPIELTDYLKSFAESI